MRWSWWDIKRCAVALSGDACARRGAPPRREEPAARESRDPGGPSAFSNHAAPGLQRVRERLRARAGDGEVRHGRTGLDARCCVALDRGAQQPFGVVRPADKPRLVAACGGHRDRVEEDEAATHISTAGPSSRSQGGSSRARRQACSDFLQ